jgi:hypothetical protein
MSCSFTVDREIHTWDTEGRRCFWIHQKTVARCWANWRSIIELPLPVRVTHNNQTTMIGEIPDHAPRTPSSDEQTNCIGLMACVAPRTTTCNDFNNYTPLENTKLSSWKLCFSLKVWYELCSPRMHTIVRNHARTMWYYPFHLIFYDYDKEVTRIML